MAEARGPRARIFIPDLDAPLKELVEEIPGVKVWSGTVVCPDNAVALVQRLAASWARACRVTLPTKATPPRNAALAVPWLQPWVLEPGFLTSYQREGVARSLTWPNESGMFVWSAGSGKTLGGIIWLVSAGPSTSVVVTKAAIRPSWDRQLREYTKNVEIRTLVGETADAGALAGLDPSRPCIFVTAYDTLPAWIDRLEKIKPIRVIFDEIHRGKSPKRWDAESSWSEGGDQHAGAGSVSDLQVSPQVTSGVGVLASLLPPKPTFALKENQAAACYRLSRASRHRLGLTATPIRDRVRDLWAQLDLVRPWDFGTFWHFAKRYCAAIENPWGGMDTRGSSNLAELKERLAFVAHSVPHSLANRSLPPARRLVTYVPISQQARPEMKKAEIRAAMGRGEVAAREMLLMEAASRKRKIITDHVLDAIDGRLKVCVFTGRRIDVESLRLAISKKAGQCPIWAWTGSDSPEEREVWRKAYMASPGPAVLVATGESAGEGIDLQDTDLAILAMLPYTPGQVIQYEGRWIRLGMKRSVLIRYFIAEGTIDEHVAAILLGKLPAIEKTVDLDEVRGLASEMLGDESELLQSMAAKVLGG